jgi:predicted Ser/Thr protein kinase
MPSPDPNWNAVEEVYDRFEKALRSGSQPRIEDYLIELPVPERTSGFRELLGTELEYRARSRDRPTIDEYQRRFPNDELIRQIDAEFPGRIGGFRIARILGQGGFSRVFLGFGANGEKRALKVYDPDYAVQLNYEWEFLNRVQGPGVVKVFGRGSEEGRDFLILEYLDGPTLRQYLQQHGRPKVSQSVRIVKQLAETLVRLHSEFGSLRDIKPENIILERGGRVRLIDFNLALPDARRRNPDFPAGGTEGYTPRDPLPYDGRGDIWSLGVLFYELLTGERPFENDVEMDKDDPRPVRLVNPEVTEPVAAICTRCLKRNRRDRYQSATQLVEELRGAEKRLHRRRRLAVGLATLLAICALATALARWVYVSSQIEALQKKGDAEYFKRNYRMALTAFDEGLALKWPSARSTERARLQVSAACADAEIAGQSGAEDYSRFIQEAEQNVGDAIKGLGQERNPRDFAWAQFCMGNLRLTQAARASGQDQGKQLEAAAEAFGKAAAGLSAYQEERPRWAIAETDLGVVLSYQGAKVRAQECFEKALPVLRELPDKSLVPTPESDLGSGLVEQVEPCLGEPGVCDANAGKQSLLLDKALAYLQDAESVAKIYSVQEWPRIELEYATALAFKALYDSKSPSSAALAARVSDNLEAAQARARAAIDGLTTHNEPAESVSGARVQQATIFRIAAEVAGVYGRWEETRRLRKLSIDMYSHALDTLQDDSDYRQRAKNGLERAKALPSFKAAP